MQVGRVDVDEQRPQLADAPARLAGALAQGGRTSGPPCAVDPLGGGGEGIGRADEVLDDAVVQVAGDPAALVVRRGQRLLEQRLALLAAALEVARHPIGERELQELQQDERADQRRGERQPRLLASVASAAWRW